MSVRLLVLCSLTRYEICKYYSILEIWKAKAFYRIPSCLVLCLYMRCVAGPKTSPKGSPNTRTLSLTSDRQPACGRPETGKIQLPDTNSCHLFHKCVESERKYLKIPRKNHAMLSSASALQQGDTVSASKQVPNWYGFSTPPFN